jgi:DNA-directed RNA polymerase subunit H
MAKKKTKINTHTIIPKHTKLSESDKAELFEKYQITGKELPSIKISDPALEGMTIKLGDVILIERKSQTAGKSNFYRSVIE